MIFWLLDISNNYNSGQKYFYNNPSNWWLSIRLIDFQNSQSVGALVLIKVVRFRSSCSCTVCLATEASSCSPGTPDFTTVTSHLQHPTGEHSPHQFWVKCLSHSLYMLDLFFEGNFSCNQIHRFILQLGVQMQTLNLINCWVFFHLYDLNINYSTVFETFGNSGTSLKVQI